MRRFAPNDLIDDACPPVAGPFSFAATAWCFFWVKPPQSSHGVKRKEKISNEVIYPFLPKQKKGPKTAYSTFARRFLRTSQFFSMRALILATANASANRNSTQNFLNAMESWVTTANLDSLVKNNSASTINMTPVRSINQNSWRDPPYQLQK